MPDVKSEITIDILLLHKIVYSDKNPEEKFQDLVVAVKTAKEQGISRRSTAALFGKLWDIDDARLVDILSRPMKFVRQRAGLAWWKNEARSIGSSLSYPLRINWPP